MSMKHSVLIRSHRTSLTLEDAFWTALKEIADRRGQSVAALITTIDETRRTNLSSAVRVFVLNTLSDEIKQQKETQHNPINGKEGK